MVTRNPRHAARLASEYFLRQVMIISDLFAGDFLLGLVFVGIAAGNNHLLLRDPEVLRAYPGLMDVPPNELRVPITVSALARSLGLSFETTRRHVNKLIQMEACMRSRRGLIITERFLISDGVVGAVKKINADLRVFISVLRKESMVLENL